MTPQEMTSFIIATAMGVIGLFMYVYRFSKQLSKLDKIDELTIELKAMNKNLTNDLVSISLLNQRVEHLEVEIKEIKEMIKTKG